MAVSYTALGNQFNVGAHRVKFRVDSDGAGGGVATIANADILALLRGDSPLRAKLSQTFVSQPAARDGLINTDQVSLYILPQVGTSQFLADVNIDGNGRPVLDVTLSLANSRVTVELVYIHSMGR